VLVGVHDDAVVAEFVQPLVVAQLSEPVSRSSTVSRNAVTSTALSSRSESS